MVIIGIIAVCLALGGGAWLRAMTAQRFAALPGRDRADNRRAHSPPKYHGYLLAWHIGLCGLVFCGLRLVFPETISVGISAAGLVVMSALAVLLARRTMTPTFPARLHVERYGRWVLMLCMAVAVLTTFGIVLSLIFESLRFFEQVPFGEFLTGLQWSPQTAIRVDQSGQSGAFGAVPVFAGTLLIMVVAMVIAVPIGLFIAVYLSEYAHPKTRRWVKPMMEILAGIPTVVYGAFALVTVGPAIRVFADGIGISVPAQSAIAAGSVMGIMIIPFISSLSDDVIRAVPQNLREGALALGATRSEAITQVIFPAALPGIMSAILLGISRAIGETMIVVMAAGRVATLTGNPLEAVTTVTVQIVALLTGDQEFESAKTLAAFALGLILFVITLVLNVIALMVVRRYQERYA